MMHLLCKYDVAPVGRNDATFAKKYQAKPTSFPKETSLAKPTSFAVGKHHSKRPLLSIGQKRSFCWCRKFVVGKTHRNRQCSFPLEESEKNCHPKITSKIAKINLPFSLSSSGKLDFWKKEFFPRTFLTKHQSSFWRKNGANGAKLSLSKRKIQPYLLGIYLERYGFCFVENVGIFQGIVQGNETLYSSVE